MIAPQELNQLKGNIIYKTDQENDYVLRRDIEKVIIDSSYRILGFLNDYMYSTSYSYLIKSDLEGNVISQLKLQCKKGEFVEGLTFFYVYDYRYLYKIDENLNVLWSLSMYDEIRDIVVDSAGDFYAIYVNSRTIQKYTSAGELVYSLRMSDDPYARCRLFCGYISPGRGTLHILGTIYKDNCADVFIDIYDTRTGIRKERYNVKHGENIEEDDPLYYYRDINYYNDEYYLLGYNKIEKYNKVSKPIWKYIASYHDNDGILSQNQTMKLFYNDTPYDQFFYFLEDYDSKRGHSIGKIDIYGNVLWKLTFLYGIYDSDFCFGVYKNYLYTSNKSFINIDGTTTLEVNNGTIYFVTEDGKLVEYINDKIYDVYSNEYYVGITLLGSKLKEDINKTKLVGIECNNEILTDENKKIILIEIPSKYNEDDNNYDYFKLVGTEKLDANIDVSLISSKEGQVIVSKDGSYYISTLKPYGFESDGGVVQWKDPSLIPSNVGYSRLYNGEDISPKYIHDFFLMADFHIFGTYLHSKKNDRPIITKKRGYYIARKAKVFYNYVFRRFSDIDIVTEYLKQSGIINTMIPEYVEKLRHHTVNMIRDMQVSHIPVLYDLKAVKKFEYMYDGYTFPIRTLNTQIYQTSNLPYIKKKDFKSIHIDSMVNMVKNEEVVPFILFIDGKAIKWSNITIVQDWYYSYLIISNIDHDKDRKYNVQSILLPCAIRYTEGEDIIDDSGFKFDDNGLLTYESTNISMAIEIIDDDVSYSNQVIIPEKPYIEVESEYNQISINSNIIVFEDGKLFENGEYYLDYHNKNIYTYIRNTDNVIFKSYYFNKANDSKNLLTKLPEQEQIKEDIVNEIMQNTQYEYLHNGLDKQFDFRYYRYKDYETNVSEAIKYILEYDLSLLIDFYMQKSNIKTYSYTGKQILNNTKLYDGFLIMPRKRKFGLDDYIIIYKNSKLYEYCREIEYETSSFKIPIFDHISENDNIDIIHYSNVCNKYYSIKIPENGNYNQYMSKDLRYDNFELYATSLPGEDYKDFNIEDSVQYKVSFDYRNIYDENGKYVSTEISVDDPYYQGKVLQISPKRQFRHMYMNVIQDTQDMFELDPYFRFCDNHNQYMVFVNNIRLSLEEFEETYGVNSLGRDRHYIHTSYTLKYGDIIEIFYVPDVYDEINIYQSNENTTLLEINKDILEYPFDKNLFNIFYQGQKIPFNKIMNVSINKICFTNYIWVIIDNIVNQESESNIFDDIYGSPSYRHYKTYSIMRYIDPDDILRKVFSYSDQWSRSIDNLSIEDLRKLIHTVITK